MSRYYWYSSSCVDYRALEAPATGVFLAVTDSVLSQVLVRCENFSTAVTQSSYTITNPVMLKWSVRTMDNSDIDCGGFLQLFEEFFSWEPLLIIQLIILLTNWSLFVTWLLNRSLTHYGDRDLLKKQSYFLLFKLNCRNPHLVSSSNPDNLNNPGSDSDQQSCHLQDKHPHFRPRNYLVSGEKYFMKHQTYRGLG